MEIKKAEFFTSIATKEKLQNYKKQEIAFVGRSNVGKSSLINALTNRKKLAITSSTPGRTRLINYFTINNDFFFVDLPGYGYAKASKSEQQKWQQLIETYLNNAINLKLTFVLVDIRHEPNENDKIMLKYLYHKNMPFKVIATKADKLTKNQINTQINIIANSLGLGKDDIFAVSANEKTGISKILEVMDIYLNNNTGE